MRKKTLHPGYLPDKNFGDKSLNKGNGEQRAMTSEWRAFNEARKAVA